MSNWLYLGNRILNSNEEIDLMASSISNLNLDPVPLLRTTAGLGRGTVRLRLAVALLSFLLLLQIVRSQSFLLATVG